MVCNAGHGLSLPGFRIFASEQARLFQASPENVSWQATVATFCTQPGPVPEKLDNIFLKKDIFMPVELLQKISRKALPLTVTDMDSIDKLRVLQAAGHVLVQLPGVNAKQQVAHVLAITELGLEALQRQKIPQKP
jgi:hypothetical protein